MRNAPVRITAARALYMLDRAMRERLLDRAFGTDERLRATAYFQQSGVEGCIYCGSPNVERWDHLVSVRSGGATVLGNMVPACQRCDDSKGSKDYTVWLSGLACHNPARKNPAMFQEITQRVGAYQEHFHYITPTDFLSALTDNQRQVYSAFATALGTFRTDLARFGLFTAQISEEELEDDYAPNQNGT
jgi:hypothetical protein